MAETRNAVPVWLTLGIVAGGAVGWLLFHPSEKSAPVVAPPPAAEAAAKDTATLAATERHFQKWGGYAVWENDFTQFAVWNERRQRPADFYEVHRTRGQFYFRSLPQLTWVLLDHGLRAPAPIRFAETVKMRAQFYQDHPSYDPAKEPVIKLPPLPPIAVASQDPVVRSESPARPPQTPPAPRGPIVLTPGADGAR